MSYKDDEEFNSTEVDINEEDVDLMGEEDGLDDSLLDDDALIDDEDDLFVDDEDEEGMEDFAGLDGSEYN